jgi:hypothetical protein
MRPIGCAVVMTSTQPNAASINAALRCKMRSPCLSELQTQSGMATTVQIGAMAVTNPTCVSE